MHAVQRSFESLGAPLSQVTFCFVDLETTGGAPSDSRITEVGAVRYRGGERLASFQSLVDPGVSIPGFVTLLTGIDDPAVRGAPPIEGVLPSFLEFARGAVLVAHNAPFDERFLRHECDRLGYDPPWAAPVCTAKLARRIVGSDVSNVRLATVSAFFRTAARPRHRALADAEACADVFHALLELGGRLGILTVGDLREAMRARGTPHRRTVKRHEGLVRSLHEALSAPDGLLAALETSRGAAHRAPAGRSRPDLGRAAAAPLLDETRRVHALGAVAGAHVHGGLRR